MSTTVIDTLSWCKHNVFASSMMQTQCICIIMTMLDSSSLISQLQFKSTIQCPSYSYIGAGGTHYASRSLILTGRRTSRAPRNSRSTWAPVPSSYTWISPGHGEVVPVVLPMGAVAAPIRVQYKAFNPGRAREHEILPLYPWYDLPQAGNGQHWRFWCPLWTVWPIQEKWPLLMAKQCFCVRYF